MKQMNGGLLLFGILALPPIRHAFEQTMAGHMLLQIPLLVLSGVWIGRGLPPGTRKALQAMNGYGVTGLALVVITALFWMLPRHLDAALEGTAYEIGKFLSLPLLVGIPLQLSWRRLTAIGRGLVWSNLIAMLWVLSWLYLSAPVRVCNNYRIDEQALVGQILLLLGFVVATALTVRAFIPSRPSGLAARPLPPSTASALRKT
ncbi:hypothetical protein [Thiohalomonas denitrificans]|uniref:Transmembrane protein n=1 Tax=Thiohalomonas denitrificans TaxID=415747 RepID=A0A1G5PHS2_9GAMM|nr:hypothetical protein [Thiohalomonas denitrificans]SCZ49053.1 hypothetical protein SAMN03097708_00009 [Thiohalomonas denitrificans]